MTRESITINLVKTTDSTTAPVFTDTGAMQKLKLKVGPKQNTSGALFLFTEASTGMLKSGTLDFASFA